MTVLVVGLGNRDRGDDGVGPAVADAVAALSLPGVDVLVEDSPTALLDRWSGADAVVVVDAIVAGHAPGSVVTVDAVARPLPPWTGDGGTHGFGVAAAVELARVLGRLPPRLAVVGVQAADFATGAPLSPDVAEAVPRAVEAVRWLAMAG